MVKKRSSKSLSSSKSLTPKVFYQVMLSVLTLLMVVMLILVVPGNDNLSGYAVALETKIKPQVMEEFIPCPASFDHLVCFNGRKAKIWFSPVFKVFDVKPNIYLKSSMSLGFQPSCWYNGEQGQLYRLQGKITKGGPCRAVKNGFLCETK